VRTLGVQDCDCAEGARNELKRSIERSKLNQANEEFTRLAGAVFTDVRKAFIRILDLDGDQSEFLELISKDRKIQEFVDKFLRRDVNYNEDIRECLRPLLGEMTDYFFRLQLIEQWEKCHGNPHSGRWHKRRPNFELAPR
jgi:hypothetical protein